MNGHVWVGSASKLRKRARGRNTRRPLPKAHETEEEAAIRRLHDAQRMARFRARRKKALEEAKALENVGLEEMSLISELRRRNIAFEIANSIVSVPSGKEFETQFYVHKSPMIVHSPQGQTKYSQLLALIEELGKDIRLTYAGSRTSMERLKIGIVQARMLVKDCLVETKINSQ